jgi:hypothetical protein
LKNLKILLGAAGFFLFSLVAHPLPGAVTPEEASGPGRVPLRAAQTSFSNPTLPGNLTAGSALFLPLVFKSFPLPPGILFVLINNFLLFVPAPQ